MTAPTAAFHFDGTDCIKETVAPCQSHVDQAPVVVQWALNIYECLYIVFFLHFILCIV